MTSSGVCLCATGKSVLGAQRQDGNSEWGTVLRDVGVFTSMVAAVYEPRLLVGHLFTSLWRPFKNFQTSCIEPSLVVFIGQSQTPI